jgi:hypothetical protein
MNRAERRKIERKEKHGKGVTLSKNELNSIKEQISDRASITTVDILMVCFALAEHRVHKFGKKRIKKTIDYIDSLVEMIVNGEATIEDYKRELKEETNVTIIAMS